MALKKEDKCLFFHICLLSGQSKVKNVTYPVIIEAWGGVVVKAPRY